MFVRWHRNDPSIGRTVNVHHGTEVDMEQRILITRPGRPASAGRWHGPSPTADAHPSMFVSFFPNRTGQPQPRVVEFDGDVLRLSTASPIQSSRRTVMSYLQWRRASN
jgi:Lipocalin-like domain